MELKHIALNAFADWVKSRPTKEMDFNQWHHEYWPEFARHCYDISRNVFIMQECIQQFERLLEPNMTWNEAICHSKLLEKKQQICLSVEVLPDEFFDDGTTQIFTRRCKTIFLRYFTNGGE